MWGWWGATKWRVTPELNSFQDEMAHKEAPLHSIVTKQLNQWPISTTSRVVISSRVVACTTYKPTNGIQWTPEHYWTSDRPQNRTLAKADL